MSTWKSRSQRTLLRGLTTSDLYPQRPSEDYNYQQMKGAILSFGLMTSTTSIGFLIQVTGPSMLGLKEGPRRYSGRGEKATRR